MKIFISLGHNNARNIRNIILRDQGASSGGFTEYGIIKEIARLLPKRYKGWNTLVFIPEWLSLADRIKKINSLANYKDIAIELHMNSWGGSGCEVFYFDGFKPWKDTAWKMSNILSSVINIKDRGAKPDTATRFGRLGFIRDTKPTAFLIELGFIDSEYDRAQVIEKGSSAFAKLLIDIYG